MKTINILAGSSSSGKFVYEEVPVTVIGNSIFRLEASPGAALGIAKGDEIFFDPKTGEYSITKRGGNVSIQIFITNPTKHQIDNLCNSFDALSGATLDGHNEGQIIFSVPASAGFPSIENILNKFKINNPNAEWYYGNVYGDDGITPLNWWTAK